MRLDNWIIVVPNRHRIDNLVQSFAGAYYDKTRNSYIYNDHKVISQMIRCSMTNLPMEVGDGIYDDGEWISWDWINGQLYKQDIQREYPEVDPELAVLFEDLVENARAYYHLTKRYLQIWGELGELYAEVKYGIKLHKPHTQGSDGKLGKDFIEIKTISPEKTDEKVEVKRQGNFSKLLVIKINSEFEFEGRFIDRKQLAKGDGKHVRVTWANLPTDENNLHKPD